MSLQFRLAWTQTLSLWSAGALRVLVFALVLAVAAITSVGFFTERVEVALKQHGGLLLGGDLVIISDHPISAKFEERAKSQGIETVKTYEFASMVTFGEASQLAEVKAIGNDYPLRGDLTIGKSADDLGQPVRTNPKAGEVWVEPRLANLLNLKLGDIVEVGERKLRFSAILIREPSRGGDMFNFAPRLMMNSTDLPSTKLIQYGSRVKYQLLFASSIQKISQYSTKNKPELGRGEKMEDVRNARPEIKLALDKAHQFLGLSAMVSVILAMVAMLLSSLPYIKQSLDTFALMRCFGASKKTVLQVLGIQTILIATFSATVGVILGYLGQIGLEKLAGSLFLEALPPVSIFPVIVGFVASICMMIAVVLPHAWQMRNITAMNILRRETLTQPVSSQAKFLPATLVMCAMILWQAHDVKLAIYTILALLTLSIVIVGLSYAFILLINRFFNFSPQSQLLNAIKLGMLGLKRRFGSSTIQMIGFSMGLMVLILLALIRNDLIRNWQSSLPLNAPNRFVINIQPAQINGINEFFKHQSILDSSIFPMVRGRLISKNGKDTTSIKWNDERAKHLAEREFNLSWTRSIQNNNKILAGKWWTYQDQGKHYLSLEQDLAKTLGIMIGDELIFDVAGEPLTLKVTSIRKVNWNSMHANFFALTPPGVLEKFSASYISSFHLPMGADVSLNQLVRLYPNLTVIDIGALIEQVRGIMMKMSNAIEYVFAFSLVAGLAVLYAALASTREERVADATLLRVFGASRRYVGVAYGAEFASVGLIAAFVAVIAANILAYYMSVNVLDIPFQFNVMLAIGTLIVVAFVIPLAAWVGLRGYLNVPPRQLLNSI